MKILLINPLIDFSSRALYKRDIFIPMPLGILYLASIAEKMGNKVKVENIHYSNFKKLIKKFKPDLVGITCATPQYNQAVKIAQIAKNYNKKIITLIGGYHPTFRWQQILSETDIFDYVFIGEGEQTFQEFLESFPDREKIKKIKGLAFKEGEKIIFTGERELISDLDSIPFPARHLVSFKVATLIASRGCPFNCKFCAIKNFYRHQYRRRSIDNVIKEISFLKKEGYRELHIRDDNFGIDKNYILEFCQAIKKQNLNDIKFTINCDIKTLSDDKVLGSLEDVGIETIGAGIQSTNDEFRSYLNLSCDYAFVEKFFEKAKNYNFQIRCFFIINSGKENENIQMIKQNIEEFYRLIFKNSNTQAKFIPLIFILDPYPGTDLEKDFMVRGVKIEPDWSLYRGCFCNYEYNDINKKSLEGIYERVCHSEKGILESIINKIKYTRFIFLSDLNLIFKLRIFFTYFNLSFLKGISNYQCSRFIYQKYF